MPSVFSVSFSHIPPAEYAQTFVKLADFGGPRRAGYSPRPFTLDKTECW
jgi:hypothetical protein